MKAHLAGCTDWCRSQAEAMHPRAEALLSRVAGRGVAEAWPSRPVRRRMPRIAPSLRDKLEIKLRLYAVRFIPKRGAVVAPA